MNELREYCIEANRALEISRKDGTFIATYMKYRYDLFHQRFGNHVFGTNRSTEFFYDTIKYLDAPELLKADMKKAIKDGMTYEILYLDWVKSHL